VYMKMVGRRADESRQAVNPVADGIYSSTLHHDEGLGLYKAGSGCV